MLNYVLTNSKKRDNMETTGNDFLERIKKIQTPVNDALEKYFNGSLDNSALKLSENEVKKTQQMLNDGGFTDWKGKKLAVDGVRGKRFEDSFNKYMQSTVYDPKVETLQRALNVNGFRDKNGNQLLTDGKYGPKTDSAVMAAAEEYRNMNNSASEKSADMPDTIDDYIKNDNKSKTIGYLENIRQNSPESFDKIMNELEQNGIDINDIDSIVGSVTDNAKNADLDYDASLEDMFSGATHPVYNGDDYKAVTTGQNPILDFADFVSKGINDIGKKAYDAGYEAQKDAQRAIWRQGAQKYLRENKQYHTSAWMLEHALQDNPEDIYRDNNSRVAYLINHDTEYLNKLDAAIKNSKNGTIDQDLKDVKFENGDLSLSIHAADIHVKGYKQNNGKWIIEATLTDTYDFTVLQTGIFKADMKSNDSSIAGYANDAAFISQKLGAINPYNITVKFYTTR